MVTRDNAEAVKETLVQAMKIAKEAWEEAEMPHFYSENASETGKIALALLAIHMYDQLE